MTIPRIYLAGPDVFFRDAERHFEQLEERCAAAGFVGVRPTDGGLGEGIGGTKAEIAARIYRGNIGLIRSCQAVLANLQPFRGPVEPDSGTVFETGFAVALGIPVHGYLPDVAMSLAEKVTMHFGARVDERGMPRDQTYGLLIEEFGAANLMLTESMTLHETFDEALAALRAEILPRNHARP